MPARLDRGNPTALPDTAIPSAAAVPGVRLPVVAIVGAPNAGKSTLFNRLVGGRRAIVDSQPGVTRDRNVATAEWAGRAIVLVDTGGLDERHTSSLAAAVHAQSLRAAQEADVAIVLLDGRAGVTPADRDVVERLRRFRTPVVYAVNKLDTPALEDAAAEFFALGVPEVLPVSAAHGRGIAELMDRVIAHLPASPEAGERAEHPIRLAIVGRPNVGKSSLVNRILGFERAIVDSTPGTTRDAIDTPFRRGERDYVLVDTAGIRRRPRVHEQLERASVSRALSALERAEAALLVVDATEGMADQDARIAGYAWERGRALVLVINKWDAVPRPQRNRARVLEALHRAYPTLADVPVVFLSARTGDGVDGLFPVVDAVVGAHRREIQTARLNEVLAEATRAQAPPSVQGKRPKFFYATQTGTAPPAFVLFAGRPELVPASYQRFLENAFRAAFKLGGVPLRLRLRQRPKATRAERT
ncbi:MAG: ribosome biogenesis GTPase Der [Candidatus Binatia bacterium]